MTKLIKKGFTISVVVATIVWAVGLAAFLPMGAVAATVVDGDLIKMDGLSSVYYYAGGERYVFPNEATYFSWYSDFSGIKTITQAELEAIPLASANTNVVLRPGTKLVKITTNPKVYAVAPNGVLHHVDSEDRATTLYGANWAQRVVDVPDSFWGNYTVGAAFSSDVHLEGALVKYADSADIYYINSAGEKQKFSSIDTFNLNRLKLSDVITISDTLVYSTGSEIAAALSSVTDTSQTGITPGTTSGTLTISLSSGTPAAQTIPDNVTAAFLELNLTAGDTDVTVTSIRLDSAGLGTATYIRSVTMYAGGSKVGTSKNINSDGYATFNFSTPITVEANTTKVITVKAKILDNQTGYFSLGVEAAANVTSSASIGGSFPVQGNMIQATDGVTVGQITLNADDNDTTAYIGQDDVSLVEFSATASGVENLNFMGLTLKNNGNLQGNEMGTLTLYHDGVSIATATMNSSKYVTFAFDAVLIKKGQSESFEIKGDINAGSNSDTMQLYVKDDTDVDAVGALYGYQATVVKTAFDTDDGDSTKITVSAGQITISWDKTAVSAADIRIDTDNIVMGQINIKANDEPVKITNLIFEINGLTDDDNEVENPELYDLATGGIIDLTYVDATSGNAATATTDEEIYIAAGTTKSYQFRLDTTSTADGVAGSEDIYTVTLDGANDLTAEGDTSGATITSITPSSVTSASMTVVASALTHQAKTLSAVNAIAGGQNLAVYKGELKAATSSKIRLTKVVFEDDASATSAFDDLNITLAQLIINGSVVKELSNQIVESSSAESKLTFSGLNYWIDAGATVTMYLKLSFVDTFDGTQTSAYALNVVATTGLEAKDKDGNPVNPAESAVAGPTVTIRTAGVLDVYGSITEVNANRNLYITGGTTSGFLGALKFDANFEDIIIKDLSLYIANDSDVADDIERVELVDDDQSTVLATSTDFTYGDYDGGGGNNDLKILFDEWGYVISEAGIKTVFIRVVTKGIGTGGEQTGDSHVDIAFLIQAVTAVGASTSTAITASGIGAVTDDGNSEFDDNFVTKTGTTQAVSVTAITNKLSNSPLSAVNNVIIGKFEITVDNGDNTDTSGNPAFFNLEDVVMTVNLNGITLTDSGTDSLYAYLESDPSNVVTDTTDLSGGSASADFDLSGLGYITDVDTLVIGAYTVSGLNAVGDSVSITLGAIGGGDFEYNNNSDLTTVLGVRLPYTFVSGGTLSM